MNFLRKKIAPARVELSWMSVKSFFKGFFCAGLKKDKLIGEFERDFADYIGIKHAIAVSSGKMALFLSLHALKAKPEDEIIVPAYTVQEVVEMIIACGLRPVFVDISLEDATMDVDLFEARITANTRFVLATHMYGNPCRIEEILEIAKKYNLIVIEDAAQACGAGLNGKKTGSFGKIGYFSFGILKNFATLGGGMVVTDDGTLAASIRKEVQSFNQVSKGELIKRLLSAFLLWIITHPVVFSIIIYPLFYLGLRKWKNKLSLMLKSKSWNAKNIDVIKIKFSPEQAALGLIQLKTIDQLNDNKIKKAFLLNRRLAEIKEVKIFEERQNVRNIYLNYVIRVKNREKLADYLFKKGIDVNPGFVVSCAQLDEFKEYWYDCPNSLIWEKENLYLPIYHPLKISQVLYMTNIIEKYYNEQKETI